MGKNREGAERRRGCFGFRRGSRTSARASRSLSSSRLLPFSPLGTKCCRPPPIITSIPCQQEGIVDPEEWEDKPWRRRGRFCEETRELSERQGPLRPEGTAKDGLACLLQLLNGNVVLLITVVDVGGEAGWGCVSYPRSCHQPGPHPSSLRALEDRRERLAVNFRDVAVVSPEAWGMSASSGWPMTSFEGHGGPKESISNGSSSDTEGRGEVVEGDTLRALAKDSEPGGENEERGGGRGAKELACWMCQGEREMGEGSGRGGWRRRGRGRGTRLLHTQLQQQRSRLLHRFGYECGQRRPQSCPKPIWSKAQGRGGCQPLAQVAKPGRGRGQGAWLTSGRPRWGIAPFVSSKYAGPMPSGIMNTTL